MKKGDTVMIYEDPITQMKPEGDAKLLKLKDDGNVNGLERWKVKFVSDGFVTNRSIYAWGSLMQPEDLRKVAAYLRNKAQIILCKYGENTAFLGKVKEILGIARDLEREAESGN